MTQDIKEIAIIGDGFAAAAALIHLLRRGIHWSKIVLIGPGLLGKGNAYNCISPFFRLNVREDLPSVFSEDPLHFARWAEVHIDDPEAQTDAGYFYRRHDFGRYISELVSKELGSDQIDQIYAKISNLYKTNEYWYLETDTLKKIVAQRVIIATGNPPPIWPCAVQSIQTAMSPSQLIERPWVGQDLGNIHSHEEIILLGGGLTALDAINALVGQGHQGLIKVIGPRAVFPPMQAGWKREGQPDWPKNLTPAKLVRFIRNYLPSAPTDSVVWQSAWEELRPNINMIWQQFSYFQRRILFKRLGWLWSLYRFRASPQTIKAYRKLEANKQIQFVLGRAKRIEVAQTVTVVLGDGSKVSGDRIFNCTGVGRDPLLSKLIADQIARPDALGKSIAVTSDYKVSKLSGGEWDDLWMIGPATMGSLGDVIAASSIAKQAEQLSIQITSK
ncbi:FAD/NAD(P)-binding protein [Polynucleobacter sp. MG-Unter2-18]|uniref:FAD/NAD(P)-binding protein n=1 Tax=Polynucleobacter sp. MG-Unter2-18 TaxID=2081052 RepID=UPI001BFD06A5|nr:FAD/NAD(P)-binding protein [Polynucleobacter sp. MG-Unter2-18]QWD94572.1 FAD/NAD(P)-binding protein [Polynucleobacter sp. MG-Unter2-18]